MVQQDRNGAIARIVSDSLKEIRAHFADVETCHQDSAKAIELLHQQFCFPLADAETRQINTHRAIAALPHSAVAIKNVHAEEINWLDGYNAYLLRKGMDAFVKHLDSTSVALTSGIREGQPPRTRAK